MRALVSRQERSLAPKVADLRSARVGRCQAIKDPIGSFFMREELNFNVKQLSVATEYMSRSSCISPTNTTKYNLIREQ